ncbi:MAG TPA: hypothetical protein VJ951_08330 [Bacteroidales bacterium]|nr:hypothetical protein [Bacteroidales bacterium]
MWKEKLRAFCEGLEVENVDMLLERGEVVDFRVLGQVMVQRIKDVASRSPLTPVSVVRQNTATTVDEQNNKSSKSEKV